MRIHRYRRTAFRTRAAVFLLAGVLAVLASGLSAPNVQAATPTLRIVSPADHAVIGNGTPITILFAVTNFNLTAPGSGGPPSPDEGHVDAYVDGVWTASASQPTIVLSFPSGTYAILLRLVSDNGTALSPDVTASITITSTQGPAVGTPRIQISYVEPNFGLVLGRDVAISFQVTDFAIVPPGRGQPVPNEGHVLVFLDGAYYSAVMAFRPVPFSDLPDGVHTVTLRLVDDAGNPLTPDASDSVTFRIQFESVVDINPYLSIAQVILAGAIFVVLFYRNWGAKVLETFFSRIRGGKA